MAASSALPQMRRRAGTFPGRWSATGCSRASAVRAGLRRLGCLAQIQALQGGPLLPKALGMPMPETLPDLSRLSLEEIAQLSAEHKLPPVEQWSPVKSGESEMRIARDGTWYHQGTPKERY